jgi:hypothetical protein
MVEISIALQWITVFDSLLLTVPIWAGTDVPRLAWLPFQRK